LSRAGASEFNRILLSPPNGEACYRYTKPPHIGPSSLGTLGHESIGGAPSGIKPESSYFSTTSCHCSKTLTTEVYYSTVLSIVKFLKKKNILPLKKRKKEKERKEKNQKKRKIIIYNKRKKRKEHTLNLKKRKNLLSDTSYH